MYVIDIDQRHAIIEFALDGLIRQDEMERFAKELKAAILGLVGRDIKLKADLRTFRPFSPEVAEVIRQVQQFELQCGVTRVAELVHSQVLALQLDRVARESGMDKILRRFNEEFSARHWLIHGAAEPASA